MEQFQYKEQLSSAKMNKLVDELNSNTAEISELKEKVNVIYDDYISAQNLI